ncbi:MAG: hypothetical protein IJ748_03440 [Bacteroidales bacterium]|nr:hypothetical protein [Bacteroidales bacterium]
MKRLLYFLFLFVSLSLSAQSFDVFNSADGLNYGWNDFSLKVEAQKVTLVVLGKKSEVNCNREGMAYSHVLFFNKKHQLGFLFVEKHGEISLGCEVFEINGGGIKPLGSFPFAAYTSENGERMNYNSILPYLSVIRSDKRTLLFINTTMAVRYPDTVNEEIVETKDFYHILTEKSFEMRTY